MLMPVVVALGLLGCSHGGSERNPSPTQATQALPDSLWQHWVHSFEDDGPGFRAYRPKGYAFPPARGREGFPWSATGATCSTRSRAATATPRWRAPGSASRRTRSR